MDRYRLGVNRIISNIYNISALFSMHKSIFRDHGVFPVSVEINMESEEDKANDKHNDKYKYKNNEKDNERERYILSLFSPLLGDIYISPPFGEREKRTPTGGNEEIMSAPFA